MNGSPEEPGAVLTPFLDRADPLPRTTPLTIIARDPSIRDATPSDADRAILRAQVEVPASRLEPGPRGPRFHVVDYDSSHPGTWTEPADLATLKRPASGWGFRDSFVNATDHALLTSRRFRAQNVYAIAARTLASFESALGRPVPWAFGGPQLYLVPTAFEEASAYYADSDQAIYFGYFPASDGRTVYACLAHDIVAHETTHAVLDGLRRRFDVPGLPDQAAFHEGFADVVALLSLLTAKASTQALIGRESTGPIRASDLTESALHRSALVTIGAEFGDALHMSRGAGIRRSVEMTPTTEWRRSNNPVWEEPHRRGEIFVAVVMRAFIGIWVRRLEALRDRESGSIDRERAAEEGAAAAAHLLTMVIRAIDYCPSVEFEFEDFLTAILISDQEVVPDDNLGYRAALEDSFAEFGIAPTERAPVVLEGRTDAPSYRNFSYWALRSDPSEAFRFIWDNAGLLGVAAPYFVHVENVRPSVRIGPRGFVVSETVIDYVEELIIRRDDLVQLARTTEPAFEVPGQIPSDAKLKIWGGGSIILDEFGGLKFHHHKPLMDWGRQQRRLEYLLRQGMWDTKGRLGFSYGTPLGQRFALFHQPASRLEEQW
jgi:hypothetical protein